MSAETKTGFTPLSRDQIAWRAAQDLLEGQYINLGLGLPVRVADFAPAGREILFHSENGIVGVGPVAKPGEEDIDLTDAGSQLVTLVPGAAIFDSAMSFAMIRGGHVDATLLGGFQVGVNRDLANWDPMIPNKGPLIGGAMDLVSGARSVRVTMQHTTRDGEPRLVETCTYPVTGVGIVDRVYTDLAVVDVAEDGFVVREMIANLSRPELQDRTGARLAFAPDCGLLSAPEL